jgi:membrane protein
MAQRKILSALRRWSQWTLEPLALFWKAFVGFHRDNGFFLSAGIAFNILVNLIPFMMLLLSLLGSYLYRDDDVLNHIRRYLGSVAPGFDPKMTQTLFQVIQARRIVGIFGFAGLIWVSTWVFGSLRVALNMVFRVPKGRGVVRGMGIDVLMILVVGCLILLSMALTSFVTIVQRYEPLLPLAIGPALQWILKFPVPLFLTCCTFFLVYIILPNRKVHFKTALLASLFASVLWEVMKQVFGWYVAHLTRLPIIYGSLSAVVAFVFWVYYSAAILLLGGKFAFLLETRANEDSGNLKGKV